MHAHDAFLLHIHATHADNVKDENRNPHKHLVMSSILSILSSAGWDSHVH